MHHVVYDTVRSDDSPNSVLLEHGEEGSAVSSAHDVDERKVEHSVVWGLEKELCKDAVLRDLSDH